MSKLIGLASAVMFLFLFVKPQNDRFLKYKVVEAYEIRPGVLMMPRYSDDGQVCEIAVERRHYSNGTAFLDSTLPREVITQIVDELVSAKEKGPMVTNNEMARLSLYAGNSVSSSVDYQNISIDIYGKASPASEAGNIVAVILWKNRPCQKAD